MSVLKLPQADRPRVSVVMVTYGGWDWPYRSLEAVMKHTDPDYEAIVVDNASWDGTGELLAELIEGAALIRNRRNEGFGPAANQGAQHARGDYLCLLNPDCLPQPGWLEPLIDTLDTDPRAGAVIPRFLDPAGRVQEAGSAVDRQGWTHAFGAGAEPDDPEHRFRRYVDYGSAACLVLRRAIFEEAGGFDPVYVPAYCEDVDLSFRLLERGLRTVFEPRSTVVHAGAASSSDVTRARLIERNRRLLLERWRERLADRPPLTELDSRPHRLVALRDAEATPRLLVLADRVPARGEPLRDLLEGAAENGPDARFTVLASAGPDGDADGLLAKGIEIASPVDPEAWLDRRRFHYTALLADGISGFDRFDRVLRTTQPQAVRLSAEGVDLSGLPGVMASIGAAPLD